MVNTGRPSRGCHACRKRRIKCDQTLAGCQRCAKIGVVCPGYRPESELRFRNATIASSSGLSALPLAITVGPDNIQSPAPWPVLLSEEAANPYSSTSNRIIQRHCGESENNSSADSSDVEDQTSDWSLDAISSRTPRSPGVGSALQLPLEIRSVCFFMHQYTLPTSQLEPHGWMAFMPHLYSQATDDSCLRLAVTATAYANAARQWCIPDQLDNARQYYGKTLWALKAALRDPGKVIEDATLGCIIALTVFEYISDDIDKGFGSHQDGYKKLLLLRESQHVNTPNAANLFSNVISQLQLATLRFRTHPAQETVRWIEGMEASSPFARLSLGCLKINQVCADAVELLSRPGEVGNNLQRLQAIMADCERADQILNGWYHVDDDGDDWKYRIIESVTAGGCVERLDLYPNVSAAQCWNFYRGSRIILHQTFLECAQRHKILDPYTAEASRTAINDEQSATSVGIIKSMVSEVIASIPFMLGEVDAWGNATPAGSGKALGGLLLIWPLGITLRCPLATKGQLKRACSALETIGYPMGLRRAITLKKHWT